MEYEGHVRRVDIKTLRIDTYLAIEKDVEDPGRQAALIEHTERIEQDRKKGLWKLNRQGGKKKDGK